MLSGSVLVLNRSWITVNVADVKRALCLVYQGYAKIVNPEDFTTYDFDGWIEFSHGANGNSVHGVNFNLVIPEVIVLQFFNRLHRKEIKFSRRNIFERDRNTCQYCGVRLPRSELTIDHVIPRCRGGGDSWENLVTACVPCNVRKGHRLLDEIEMPLLKRPRKPLWISHFGFHNEGRPRKSWRKFGFELDLVKS